MNLSRSELALLVYAEKPGLWLIYYTPFITQSNWIAKVFFSIFPVLNLSYDYYLNNSRSYLFDAIVICYTCLHLIHNTVFWRKIIYTRNYTLTFKAFYSTFFGVGSFCYYIAMVLIDRRAIIGISVVSILDCIIVNMSKFIKWVLILCTSPTSDIGLRIRNNFDIPDSYVGVAYMWMFMYVLNNYVINQNQVAPPPPPRASVVEDVKHIAPAVECSPEVIEKLESNIERVFICPISNGLILRPVITPRGITYDFDPIREWIELHGADPDKTSVKISIKDLVTNFAIRELLEFRIKKFTSL